MCSFLVRAYIDTDQLLIGRVCLFVVKRMLSYEHAAPGRESLHHLERIDGHLHPFECSHGVGNLFSSARLLFVSLIVEGLREKIGRVWEKFGGGIWRTLKGL